MEGRHCYNASACRQDGLVLPVAEYGHDQGCAIVGGYVSRDPAEPSLWGGYFYGDSCTGRIWGLDASAADPKAAVMLDSGRSISSFGEDEAGRVYLTDLGSGELYRIVAGESVTGGPILASSRRSGWEGARERHPGQRIR